MREEEKLLFPSTLRRNYSVVPVQYFVIWMVNLIHHRVRPLFSLPFSNCHFPIVTRSCDTVSPLAILENTGGEKGARYSSEKKRGSWYFQKDWFSIRFCRFSIGGEKSNGNDNKDKQLVDPLWKGTVKFLPNLSFLFRNTHISVLTVLPRLAHLIS